MTTIATACAMFRVPRDHPGAECINWGSLPPTPTPPWVHTTPTVPREILTGADHRSERMLPWWLGHVRRHTGIPVTLADFGLSDAARRWCVERGLRVTPKIAWRDHVFFGKPFAVLHGRGAVTLWLDSDAEVRADPAPLMDGFDAAGERVQLAYSGDLLRHDAGTGFYRVQAGVLLWRHGANLARWWAALAWHGFSLPIPTRMLRGLGDQAILNRLVDDLVARNLHDELLRRFDQRWNHLVQMGPNPDALILHHAGKKDHLQPAIAAAFAADGWQVAPKVGRKDERC